jgi:hypothetical protein
LDVVTGGWGSFSRMSFHQSQGIPNEALQQRSRGDVQLLQCLIDFQGEHAHALNLMN